MKVLITGATGYVGRHLLMGIKNSKHEIFALVRNNQNYDWLYSCNATPLLGNLTNKKCFDNFSTDFDVIIHLAFSLFPGADKEMNINGTNNIISFGKRNPLKKFIYISSQLVYGSTSKDKIIDEDYPCRTKMTFGKHQLYVETKLKKLSETGFPTVILRPSEIYGGKGGFFKEVQLNGYLNGKIPVIGKGNNAICFTYMGDLVQAIIQTINKQGVIGHVFNINTPGILTLNELIQFIKRNTQTRPIKKIPVFMAWFVAGIAIIFSKLLAVKPFIDFDVVRIATMQSGARSTQKSQIMLDFIPK